MREGRPELPAIATELMYLFKVVPGQWQAVLEYVDGLPDGLRNLPVMREQRSLAVIEDRRSGQSHRRA